MSGHAQVPPPAEELEGLRRENAALSKRVGELEAECGELRERVRRYEIALRAVIE